MKKLLALVLALVMCMSIVAYADGETKAAEGKTMLYYTAYIGDFGLADMGWRAAQAQNGERGNTARVGNHRPNSTYYPGTYASARAQQAQQSAPAPQYSRRVDAYRQAQTQTTRRSR